MSNYYFMRCGKSNVNIIEYLDSNNVIAFGWGDYRLSEYESDAELAKDFKKKAKGMSNRWIGNYLGQMKRFRGLKEGDKVVVPILKRILVCEVLDTPFYNEESIIQGDFNNQVKVKFLRTGEGELVKIPRSDLPTPMQRSLTAQPTIWSAERFAETIESLMEKGDNSSPEQLLEKEKNKREEKELPVKIMKDKLSLQEIANWQLESEKSEVELPKIQRDFVWKTKQIEDLWDSILRGYPIGSFLMQQLGDGKYDLLDGQQRATAIMLGFYDPYTTTENAFWSKKLGNPPTIWIDIDSETKPASSKYSIRVTTKSHPWGYQATKNNEVLSVAYRRKALEIFEEQEKNKGKNYTQFESTDVFPYDSSMPLPLVFMIKSKSVEDLFKKIIEYFPEHIQTKRGSFANKEEFISRLQEKKDELKKQMDVIQSRIKEAKINYDVIKGEVVNEEVDEKSSKSDPTLFVRINSSGTPLSNDDLIYSIYKSKFPKTQELVEEIGANFCLPRLVISLAIRLAYSLANNNSFPKKMNVRDFQRNIEQEEFCNRLEELIGKVGNSPFKELFNQGLEVLKGHELKDEIPPFLIKQFVTKHTDAFLFLLAWLYKNEIEPNNKISSKLYAMQWFGFKNFPAIWCETGNANFFDRSINNLTELSMDKKKGMRTIIPPKFLEEFPKNITNENYKFKPTEEIFAYYTSEYLETNQEEIKQSFEEFINWIKDNRNKTILAFAQREYLNTTFKDYNSMDDLEDTNVPWDWDHIYPKSWLDKKHNQIPSVKYWNNTIGNLRALALEQNRSENANLTPPERLGDKDSEICKDSFVLENDYEFWKDLTNKDAVKEYSPLSNTHNQAIVTRMLNIYKKFWEDLNIQDLTSPFIQEETELFRELNDILEVIWYYHGEKYESNGCIAIEIDESERVALDIRYDEDSKEYCLELFNRDDKNIDGYPSTYHLNSSAEKIENRWTWHVSSKQEVIDFVKNCTNRS